MLFVFLLQLVRCHNCERHHYRPIMVATARVPVSEAIWKDEPAAASSERKTRRLA